MAWLTRQSLSDCLQCDMLYIIALWQIENWLDKFKSIDLKGGRVILNDSSDCPLFCNKIPERSFNTYSLSGPVKLQKLQGVWIQLFPRFWEFTQLHETSVPKGTYLLPSDEYKGESHPASANDIYLRPPDSKVLVPRRSTDHLIIPSTCRSTDGSGHVVKRSRDFQGLHPKSGHLVEKWLWGGVCGHFSDCLFFFFKCLLIHTEEEHWRDGVRKKRGGEKERVRNASLCMRPSVPSAWWRGSLATQVFD